MNLPKPTEKTRALGLSRILSAGLLAALCGLLAPNTVVADSAVQVFAEFASAAGESGVSEARLWVDGEEVTDAAAVSPIRISYALPGDFPTGTHEARVVVVDSLGRSHEKSWNFEVSEQRPELVAFFTDQLTLMLDPLPRRTLLGRVSLSGTSLPGVEIELRRGGVFAGRTETSLSGRFSLTVDIEEGDNELTLAASRPATGEEGRELRVRLERLVLSDASEEPEPREADDLPELDRRGGPDLPESPNDRRLSEEDPVVVEQRRSELPPGGVLRGGHDSPEAPEDRRLPNHEVDAVVVITKPDDGDLASNGKVTVLGRAPAGWQVTVLVNGLTRGDDRANPAGHFTVPRVRLEPGNNELIAEAEEPGTGRVLSSKPVLVDARPAAQALIFSTPLRRGQTVRDAVWRLEGRAGAGAELEIELNGRLIMTEVAGHDGRFALLIPLERGLNRIVVEAFEADGVASVRSRPFSLRRVGSARRGGSAVVAIPPLERKELPGRGSLGRLQPLR